MNPATKRAIRESFDDGNVKVGYAATGIYTGLGAALPHLGEDLERGAIAAGVSAAVLLVSTLALQGEIIATKMKEYQISL